MLVNGVWSANWNPYQSSTPKGEFVRQTSSFRNWITEDGAAGPTGIGGFQAEADRYHLYIALICPWASRTLMAREMLGLQDAITVSVVEPFLTDAGWRFGSFPGADTDPLHGYHYVHNLYTHSDPACNGRATVPVLWDKQTDTLVNNESGDILAMLNGAMRTFAKTPVDLRPTALQNQIESLNQFLYDKINNGVYKAGFAKSQAAYEEAVRTLFGALNELDSRLRNNIFLLGECFTESDIRLFVTLVRFDAAYHGLFKCNLKRLSDYPHLQRYMQEIYQRPGVASTVNLTHIKTGYYSVKALNPSGIIPLGPDINFDQLITE